MMAGEAGALVPVGAAAWWLGQRLLARRHAPLVKARRLMALRYREDGYDTFPTERITKPTSPILKDTPWNETLTALYQGGPAPPDDDARREPWREVA